MNGIEMSRPYELKEHCPQNPEEVAYYTEVLINGEFKIPDLKPDLEQVINITRKLFITKITPVPVKLNHGCAAGCKILVNGFVRIGLEYSAMVPEQSVHFFHITIPFEAMITKDSCLNPIPLEDCDLSRFNLYVCVEHMAAQKIDPRTLEPVAVLLVWMRYKDQDADHASALDNKCQDSDCSEPYTSKQLSISQMIVIPREKPPMAEIIGTSLKIEIKRAEIINTPLAAGSCNIPLQKVIIIGKAEIQVKYVAVGPEQRVHALVISAPIRTLIEWIGGPPPFTPLCVKAIKEHFRVEFHDRHHLFASLVLRLIVSENEYLSDLLD